METDFNIEIKRKFLELLSNSSSHGIPNIIKTHNTWLKLMWFVFFLISLGCCSFLIISGFVQYFSYEVVTIASRIKSIVYTHSQRCSDRISQNNHL